MSSHFQFEQWVPFPLEEVFLFFANPKNLPRIMPPATGTRLEELRLIPPPEHATANAQSLAGVGSEIVTSFRLFPFLPLRPRWIALITEFKWNHHFADVQKTGPFKRFHHRHELTAETRNGISGTTVRDVIEYEIGFGFLGRVADQIVVDRQFRRTFAYRHAALAKLG
jgi:ligand-binding SRPBCC domain-containing protein